MRHEVNRIGMVVLSLLWIAAAVPSAWAQSDAERGEGVGAVEEAAAPSLRQSLGLDSLLQGSPLAQRILGQLSDHDLQALAAGADPARIAPLADALGELDAQLVFTPVTPCRLIDTRLAGGAFTGGEQRDYDLIGPADYSGIGGNAAGCGIPGVGGIPPIFTFNTTRALVLNIVAVGAAGAGDFRAFPSNEAVPNASVINYANLSSVGLNIANGIVLKTCAAFCIDFVLPFTCGNPCPVGDLSFLADVSGTHLVVDVVGYFSAATQPTGVSEGTRAQTAVLTLTAACQQVASCSVTNGTDASRGVLVIGQVNLQIEHALGTVDETHVALSETSATCDGTVFAGEPDPGQGIFDLPSTAPSFPAWDATVTVVKRFSLAANTSQSYFLNAVQQSGASASDVARSAAIDCFIP